MGQKIFLRWLPIYWAGVPKFQSLWNLGICNPGIVQNWLESLWLIWSLDAHLSIYVNLDWANLSYWFLCCLLMSAHRLFCMAPIWIPIGTPLSQYVVVWIVCIWGVLVVLSRRVPLIASWSAISMPIMPMFAPTFCIVIFCVDQVIWLTKVVMCNLSGWLCLDDGCCMWLCIWYILLRCLACDVVYCLMLLVWLLV